MMELKERKPLAGLGMMYSRGSSVMNLTGFNLNRSVLTVSCAKERKTIIFLGWGGGVFCGGHWLGTGDSVRLHLTIGPQAAVTVFLLPRLPDSVRPSLVILTQPGTAGLGVCN